MVVVAQHPERSTIVAYAFALPIPAGKTEAVRRFTEECLGPRRAEVDGTGADRVNGPELGARAAVISVGHGLKRVVAGAGRLLWWEPSRAKPAGVTDGARRAGTGYGQAGNKSAVRREQGKG
jgi:hypothetical protein